MNSKEIMELMITHLTAKTRSKNTDMFEVLIAQYFSIVASNMRATVRYLDEVLPLNMYSLILAPSGTGKNMSVNTLNDIIGKPFHDKFKMDVFLPCAQQNIVKLASRLAGETGIDDNIVREELIAEMTQGGGTPFTFGSATLPAVRQYHRLGIIGHSGALSCLLDEVGLSINEVKEVLPAFLTLYDKGMLEQKLLKGTTQVKQQIPITGSVPSNLLMFGTQAGLLDSGTTEKEFKIQLANGYARRLVCAYIDSTTTELLTPEEVYTNALNRIKCSKIEQITQHFTNIASPQMYSKCIVINKPEAIRFLEYEAACAAEANKLSAYREQSGEKAELVNRAYRAVKLAGTFAYIENSPNVTDEHIDLAIAIIDKSSKAFSQIINSKKDWQKLAEYLLDKKEAVTHDELLTDLPFMAGKNRKDILDLAIAHGYKNNIIIERALEHDIEFISAKQLELTDLSKILVSYSRGITEGFGTYETGFENLHKLVASADFHYCNHGFKDNYRSADNVNTHFNLVIVDVDGTATIEETQLYLKDYKFLLATTKSHTEESHRFRILLPITHKLTLSTEDFKEFMENLFNWLPIMVDESARDIARKWVSHPGKFIYNEGKLLDATAFIPRTKKAATTKQLYLDNVSLGHLERWCISNSEGNRNNVLLRYGAALLDSGKPLEEIESKVLAMNKKFPKSLPVDEIQNTVFKTLRTKQMKRD